jgi:biotin operon repressor
MPKKNGPYRKEGSWRPVVDAVVKYHAENGYPPSEEDIAAAIGRSRTAVRSQLNKLISDGVLVRTLGKRRSLRLA